MNILITGGAGYIGSHLAVDLLNAGHNIIIVDNLVNSKEFIIDNIKEITEKDVIFYAYNCKNEHLLDQVFTENEIDLVIHAAAEISSIKSINDPIYFYDNNVNSLLTLQKVMLKHGVNKLIFSSSSTVYGEESASFSESSSTKQSESPYGVSKQICESIVTSLSNEINTAVLRYFNPIGAHSSGLLGAIPKNGADGILSSLFKAKYINEQLIIFGDNYNTHDGTCIRDYIDINDLVDAHQKVISWLFDSEQTDVFNISTGKGTSVKEMISIFEGLSDNKINVVSGSRRKGDLPTVVGNNDKAKNILSWTPKNDIIYSIKESMNWYEYIFNKQKDDTLVTSQ